MHASRDAGLGKAVWVWHAAADSPINPIKVQLAKRIKTSSQTWHEERNTFAHHRFVLISPHSSDGPLFIAENMISVQLLFRATL